MLEDFSKIDAGLMNLINKRKIIRIIRQNSNISRSDLVKETRLTAPTVSRIVDELVNKDHLAMYVGVGNSRGGRPPMIVSFDSKNNYIIGIDIGGANVRGILVDLNGNLLFEIQNETEINKGYSHIISLVVSMIRKLEDWKGIDKKQIKGVGIGVAGLVNSETGIVEFSPDFGWENVNVIKQLKKHISLPVFLDNSTRLMALGELEYGNKRSLKNFAVVNVGYGIAAGLVVEGNLVKGRSGFAGEFGHITVDYGSSIRCHCGRMGCLEALASGHRIASLGKDLVKNELSPILKELCNGEIDQINARTVRIAAQQNDAKATEIYNKAIDYLCIGLSDLVNLLDPETIFIGGGVSLSGDFFFNLLSKNISKYLLSAKSKIPITHSTFKEYATAMGAVALVLNEILDFKIETGKHHVIAR